MKLLFVQKRCTLPKQQRQQDVMRIPILNSVKMNEIKYRQRLNNDLISELRKDVMSLSNTNGAKWYRR